MSRLSGGDLPTLIRLKSLLENARKKNKFGFWQKMVLAFAAGAVDVVINKINEKGYAEE